MNINGTSVAEYRAPESELPCSKPSVWTGKVIIVLVVGIVLSLSLVAVIVHGLRLIYKPKRPHIKKTFVVRKQLRHNSSSDTPLTNRPLATEQCEITIENCCNMNICETVSDIEGTLGMIPLTNQLIYLLSSPASIPNWWGKHSRRVTESASRKTRRY